MKKPVERIKSERLVDSVNAISDLIRRQATGNSSHFTGNPKLRQVLENYFLGLERRDSIRLLKKLREFNYTPAFWDRIFSFRNRRAYASEFASQVVHLHSLPKSISSLSKIKQFKEVLMNHFANRGSSESIIFLGRLRDLK